MYTMQKQQKVIRFGSIKASIGLPNLIENQTESFKWFLQKDVPSAKRKNQGLQNVFLETFPIVSPNDDIELEFVDYDLGEPKYNVQECKERVVTYAAPLKATIRLLI